MNKKKVNNQLSSLKELIHFFSAIKPSNQLQKLATKIMEHAKCNQAHADSGSPVLESNNVCAGGEEGIIYFFYVD